MQSQTSIIPGNVNRKYKKYATIWSILKISCKFLFSHVYMLSHFSHVWLCSPPGSSAHGILQTRTLEWVTMATLGDLPNPGIEPKSFMSPTLAGGFFTTRDTWEALFSYKHIEKDVKPRPLIYPLFRCNYLQFSPFVSNLFPFSNSLN